jgi:hypothetical protein
MRRSAVPESFDGPRVGVLERVEWLSRLRKKSLLPGDRGPQPLKPDLFSINYVRPEGRTLQKLGFSAACEGACFRKIR